MEKKEIRGRLRAGCKLKTLFSNERKLAKRTIVSDLMSVSTRVKVLTPLLRLQSSNDGGAIITIISETMMKDALL